MIDIAGVQSNIRALSALYVDALGHVCHEAPPASKDTALSEYDTAAADGKMDTVLQLLRESMGYEETHGVVDEAICAMPDSFPGEEEQVQEIVELNRENKKAKAELEEARHEAEEWNQRVNSVIQTVVDEQLRLSRLE